MASAQNKVRSLFHRPPPPPLLSDYSTRSVPDSSWACHDFMLGAGMVIFQENTHKIVVVHETKRNYWFFPRGRKDRGESLEQTALREAHEESGYRTEFLPLINQSNAPTPPGAEHLYNLPNTEPIFITTTYFPPRMRRGKRVDDGGEYLTTWYAGKIPENAVREIGTGMPDEQDYQGHLLHFDDAMKVLCTSEARILRYTWDLYVYTFQYHRKLEEERKTVLENLPPDSDSEPGSDSQTHTSDDDRKHPNEIAP